MVQVPLGIVSMGTMNFYAISGDLPKPGSLADYLANVPHGLRRIKRACCRALRVRLGPHGMAEAGSGKNRKTIGRGEQSELQCSTSAE